MSLDDGRASIAAQPSSIPTRRWHCGSLQWPEPVVRELAARRWTDVGEDGMSTIDSAIEVIHHPGVVLELNDAPTKTSNARTMTLDPDS